MDDNGGLVIDLYPGEQHMDGKKAIQYVRYRDGEGDIGRIGRQQKFMKACLAQVLTPEILLRLPDIVKEVSSAVKTDMSVTELLSFAKMMKTFQANGLEAQMVPGQPAYHKDISYWIPDITDVRDLLASELGLTLTEAAEQEAQEAEDKYDADLPKDLGMLAHKTSGGTKLTDKAEKDEDDEPMKPEEISVMVINSSGIDGAGAEVAAALQRKASSSRAWRRARRIRTRRRPSRLRRATRMYSTACRLPVSSATAAVRTRLSSTSAATITKREMTDERDGADAPSFSQFAGFLQT